MAKIYPKPKLKQGKNTHGQSYEDIFGSLEPCRNHKRYRGLRKPTCNGGNPCQPCQEKFKRVQTK